MRPAVGAQFAGEAAHQRGLADAVRTDDGDAFAAFDIEGDIADICRPTPDN